MEDGKARKLDLVMRRLHHLRAPKAGRNMTERIVNCYILFSIAPVACGDQPTPKQRYRDRYVDIDSYVQYVKVLEQGSLLIITS